MFRATYRAERQQTERGDQMWAQMFSNSAAIAADTGADALLG
jgi:hypothetical protein